MDTKILLIDDDAELCTITARQLRLRGFDVAHVTRLAEAEKLCATATLDAVVTDIHMPDGNGIEFAKRLHQLQPELPVLVITSYGSMDTAIAALRAGAYDFITKPIEMELLTISLKRAVESRHIQHELKSLKKLLASQRAADGFVGESEPMKRLFSLIARTAATGVTALVTGESGTGKELAARAIHQQSSRSSGAFVAINCTALPEALLESELFGYVKGAFTDAKSNHAGLLQRAHGGTLFLDEIGDMPLGLQAKLLRVLEQKTFRPVGATAEVAFDARIISATNSDLTHAVASKRFREDLYYRLNVLQLKLPPLRDRGRDILLLAQHFIDSMSPAMNSVVKSLGHGAAARLMNYSWPGNVRELKNCIERALALGESSELQVMDLPDAIAASTTAIASGYQPGDAQLLTLDEMESRYIQNVLAVMGGNKARAAKVLGIERKSLYRKLERLPRKADEQ